MTAVPFAMALPVGALVFDGLGRVHAFGNRAFSSNAMRLLDVATGADTLTLANAVNGVAHVVLHPSGQRMYFADRGVSPDDIHVSLLGGVSSAPQDSRYHGDYAMCGRVWASPGGSRLYTACGNTFPSSTVTDQDMLYSGVMALSGPPLDHAAVSLSENPGGTEVVLLEQSRTLCDARFDRLFECFTHLAICNSATLALTARYSLAPITVAGNRFAQIGRFVFHRRNAGTVLLSELRDAPDPTQAVRLSLLP